MKTKTKILIGAGIASVIVLASLRKKLVALLASSATPPDEPVAQATVDAAAKAINGYSPLFGFTSMLPGIGADPAPSTIASAGATTDQVAKIVSSATTGLGAILGVTLTAMSVAEKKKALSKA